MDSNPLEARIFPVRVWDLREIARLHHKVFCEVDPLFRISRPDGLTQALLDEICAKWKGYFEVLGKERWMKMVAKGKIVAYAVWHTDGQRELNFVEPGEFQPDGTTSAMKAAWLLNENASKLNLSLKRVHIREKRYIFLAPLLTAREHRGKKFGKALLEDGCEYARKRHLKCYFMSLPGAKDFYLKHGFEILGSREEVIGGEDRLESVDRPRPLVNTLMRMKSLG